MKTAGRLASNNKRENTAILSTTNVEYSPAQEPVCGNDANQDADPLSSLASLVIILLKDAPSINQALTGQLSLVHTSAPVAGLVLGTRVGSSGELINHHTLENVALVVNVVENISPEGVKAVRCNHEAAYAHPESVGKRGSSKCDHEDRDNGGD